jgi:hypothetical protein
METIIINPIRKGRFSKMKKRKGHRGKKHGRKTSLKSIVKAVTSKFKRKKGRKGKKHGSRKGHLNAGLRAWLNKHKKGSKGKKSSRKTSRKVRTHKIKQHRKRVTGRVHRPRLHEVGPKHWQRSGYSRIPMGVVINPLLRGRHKKGRKGKKSHYRKGVRNMNIMGSVKEMLKDAPEAVFAGAGLLGVTAVTNFLPISVKTNDMFRVAGKIGITVGLGVLTRMVIKKPAISKMVVLGGTLNVLNDLAGITKLSMFLPVESKQIATSSANVTTTETTATMLINDKTLNTLFPN